MYKVKPGAKGQVYFGDKRAKGKNKHLRPPIELANASQEQLKFLLENNLSSYIVFDADKPKENNITDGK